MGDTRVRILLVEGEEDDYRLVRGLLREARGAAPLGPAIIPTGAGDAAVDADPTVAAPGEGMACTWCGRSRRRTEGRRQSARDPAAVRVRAPLAERRAGAPPARRRRCDTTRLLMTSCTHASSADGRKQHAW